MAIFFPKLLAFLPFLAPFASARYLKKPGSGGGGGGKPCNAPGQDPVTLYTMADVERNNSFCNMVVYNRVYHLDEFINIHKGGPESIERNCGKNATWLFENLQCIAMVPDHFEGMLNMCHNYIVGVIEGSDEDPCANTNYPPSYPYPDFASCDVYDNITCQALADVNEMLPIDETLLSLNVYPANRLWTAANVADTLNTYVPNMATNRTDHCFTILDDWVYDLGTNPLDGSAPFYLKHGNSWYPQEILRHCGGDMTDAYFALHDMFKECVPDHTHGGMNVLSGYLVGAIKGSKNDPCNNPPPSACDTFNAKSLEFFDPNNWADEATALGAQCPVVILDKVYDLAEFMDYHPGGFGAIKKACGKDATRAHLDRPRHKPAIHLGTIQRFQLGAILDGMTDPCGPNYDDEWDF